MSDVTSRLSIMRFEPWTELDTVVGWRLHESGRDDLTRNDWSRHGLTKDLSQGGKGLDRGEGQN